MLEIELKARVHDRSALEDRLRRVATSHWNYQKEDLYFTHAERSHANPPTTLFRLRNENGTWIVTGKIKTISEGIEVSREREFIVSHPEDFKLLMADLGFSPYLRKTKVGTAWDCGDIKAEVSEVGGLGTYIELEILAPEDLAPSELESARQRLVQFLHELGLSKSDLEPTPYTELLRNINFF